MVNTRDGNVVVGIQTLGARGNRNEMVLAKLDLRGKQLWRARVTGATSLRLRKCTQGGRGGLGPGDRRPLDAEIVPGTPAGGLIVTGTEVPANYRGAVAYVLHIAASDLGKAGLKPPSH